MRTSAGVVYLHSDHLGSASATSGASVGTQIYYAFGNIRSTTGTTPTDFGFTGQRRDASAGLMYYGARYYDATLGRFVSADTIVPQAGNPQGLNRYSYVGNNPLKYTDPSGHCWGVASGARSLPTYDVTCGNVDMALTIVQHPNARLEDKAFAGVYIVGEAGAHAALVIGTAALTWHASAAVAAGGGAAEVVSGAVGGTVSVAGDIVADVTQGKAPNFGKYATDFAIGAAVGAATMNSGTVTTALVNAAGGEAQYVLGQAWEGGDISLGNLAAAPLLSAGAGAFSKSINIREASNISSGLSEIRGDGTMFTKSLGLPSSLVTTRLIQQGIVGFGRNFFVELVRGGMFNGLQGWFPDIFGMSNYSSYATGTNTALCIPNEPC